MMTLALVQATAAPDWVGPTAAISLVVIAVSMLGAAGALAYAALRIAGEAKKLSSMIQGHQEDVAQTLAGARRLADQGQDLLVIVRQEIGAFTQTSRRIRRKLVRGVDNVEAKLADLETLASNAAPLESQGKLVRVAGLVLEATGIKVPLGSVCRIQMPSSGNNPRRGAAPVNAEVVGFSGDRAYLMPTDEVQGLSSGATRPRGAVSCVPRPASIRA